MLMVPATFTSPDANITTGVLVVFLPKVTVTPDGMFTEVKLNTPLSGNCSRVFTVGEKAPSAPVLPLSNAWARGLPRTIPSMARAAGARAR